MKKILFPAEFSDYSPQVLKYALELAKRFKAKLVAMQVYPTSELIPRSSKEELERRKSRYGGDVVSQAKSVLANNGR